MAQMTIAINAPIGSGKSSLTKILSEFLEVEAYYEPASSDDNPYLAKFYENKEKYAFMLQIFFLNERFGFIKKALNRNNAVIDSSIYTDQVFLERLFKDGIVSEEELDVYNGLIANMLAEVDELPKKAPDLMISINISFETELARIQKRGREFEQKESEIEYFKNLLADYKVWFSRFNICPKLKIEGDDIDFVNNMEDRRQVIQTIVDKLLAIGTITKEQYHYYQTKLETEFPTTPKPDFEQTVLELGVDD